MDLEKIGDLNKELEETNSGLIKDLAGTNIQERKEDGDELIGASFITVGGVIYHCIPKENIQDPTPYLGVAFILGGLGMFLINGYSPRKIVESTLDDLVVLTKIAYDNLYTKFKSSN